MFYSCAILDVDSSTLKDAVQTSCHTQVYEILVIKCSFLWTVMIAHFVASQDNYSEEDVAGGD